MVNNSAREKVKKERNEKFLFKNYAYTQSFLSFFTFSHALLLSIPSPQYQSEMTNPLFSQYAFVTISRPSKNAKYSVKNDTQVYYYYHVWN